MLTKDEIKGTCIWKINTEIVWSWEIILLAFKKQSNLRLDPGGEGCYIIGLGYCADSSSAINSASVAMRQPSEVDTQSKVSLSHRSESE